MTSQLNVDTIVDKAGSGGTNVKIGNTSTYVSDGGAVTQNAVQSLAKAWLLGGDDASLTDSFNISAGTDNSTGNGTGDYTHAFSNNMGAANAYTVAGMAQDVNSKNCQLNMMSSNAEYAAASFRYQTGFVANTSGAQPNHDCNGTSVQICGDLA